MNERVLEKFLEPAQLGLRIDKALVELFPDISRTEIQRCIKNHLVSVDGNVVSDSSKKIQHIGLVKLTHDIHKLSQYDLSPENIPIDVLYEDEYIIIINKPAGLVCHPAPGHKDGTLVNALAGKWQLSDMGERPGIVHRLDKDTSGIMLIAKNNIAHAKFADLFANHKGSKIRRFYTCFVFGVPTDNEGRIDTKIIRHPKNRQMFTVNQTKGKQAITLYRILKTHYLTSTKPISKIECELLTGRTHQIRVHMQYLKCPLIGDQTYGKRRVDATYPMLIRSFERQALHSSKLMFTHPFFNKEMEFTASIPPDMLELETLLSNSRIDTHLNCH